MNDLINTENLLQIKDGQPMADSLTVAERFGKRHKDVLRSIENLECSSGFTERNFAPSEYKDSTGRTLPMYLITRDGFSFLVMGFTGTKAAQCKEKYIAAFNRMETELRQRMATPEPQLATLVHAVEQQASLLVQQAQINQQQSHNIDRLMAELGHKVSVPKRKRTRTKAETVGPSLFTLERFEIVSRVKQLAERRKVSTRAVYNWCYHDMRERLNIYFPPRDWRGETIEYLERHALLDEMLASLSDLERGQAG